MKKGQVIYLNNPKDYMGKRIQEAKEKAEEALQNKVEQSRSSDVDVRDFFSNEELERIFQDNEFFQGKIADLSKKQRYDKAVMAAKWMEANSIEVVNVEIEKISPDRPNAIIVIDIRRLASLRGMELQVLTALFALADSAFLSGIKDATIRFTFGIEGIWKE